MKKLSPEVISFFHSQGFVIVSTVDQEGFPHSSCKALVKIDSEGRLYLVDVYSGVTTKNLKRNPQVSVSAVDEYRFIGYCLKGRASIVTDGHFNQEIIKKWEDTVTSRLAKRMLTNLSKDKSHGHHPEAKLPLPQHLIVIEVEQIVDLSPHHLKKEA